MAEAIETKEEVTITKAEERLLHWQYKMAGHFFQLLFDAMAHADTKHLDKLAKGFPEEVTAYARYISESGYWADVKRRAKIVFPNFANVYGED